MSWAKRIVSAFLGGVGFPGSRGKRTGAPRGRRVTVEALEDRRLLSVGWQEHSFDSQVSVRFTADMNMDGAVDIVYAAPDEGQYVWPGKGPHVWREFNSTLEYPIGAPLNLHSVVDLNGDESPDFFVLLDSGECGWYENDGSGGFTEHSIGDYRRVHSVTDANGDGFLDILVAFSDTESGWYENDGSGNFTAKRIPVPAEDSAWFHAADMNEDGHMDFLVKHAGWIGLHLNDGNDSFTDHLVTTATGRLYVRDFDADGDLDILLLPKSTLREPSPDPILFESYGDGGFDDHVLWISSSGPISGLHIADLNGDGDLDIVVYANEQREGHSKLMACINYGQGRFHPYTIWSGRTTYSEHTMIHTATLVSDLLVTDVTNDGYPDIMMASREIQREVRSNDFISEFSVLNLYENDGSGRFTWNQLDVLNDNMYGKMHAADFDGDSDADILVNKTRLTAWFENLTSVDYREIPNVDLSTNEFLHGFASRRKGLVTVDATFDSAAGDVTLRLLDSQGRLVDEVTGSDGYLRIDHTAPSGGNAYALHVMGSNPGVDLRICNLVEKAERGVTVLGTNNADRFAYLAGERHDVTINGVLYHFDRAEIDTVDFDGGTGADEAVMTGSAGEESATFYPGQAQ